MLVFFSVSHTGEKSVLMTILELARIGYKFGLDPPNLIKMEKEIEKEEEEVVVEVKPPKPSGLDAEVISIATAENVFDLDAEVRVGEGAVACWVMPGLALDLDEP